MDEKFPTESQLQVRKFLKTELADNPIDFSEQLIEKLKKIGIQTWAELISHTKENIAEKGIDDASLNEIEEGVRSGGLYLGMDPEEIIRNA